MNVAVIGTGYVGLVSGACMAELGHQVTCVDNAIEKIEKLRRGIMPIYEPGLEELVKRNVASGRLRFTTDYEEAVPEAEVISIAVGTPSAPNGSADLSYLFAAAEAIGRHLKGYAVIADKSTVPVGTSEAVREAIKKYFSGEFDVVSNPEVLREGHAVADFLNPSRIILGASSQRASDVMLKLYAHVHCPKVLMSPRSAELTKYAANSFLATKISFINEMARMAEEVGADIEEVAEGIGTDPRIGKDFLRAGLGWGGSCFPKDVRAILHLAETRNMKMPIVRAACEVNISAKLSVLEKLRREFTDFSGKTFALLGLAFKNNTDDTRESAALELLRLFTDAGVCVRAYDPIAQIFDQELASRVVCFKDPYEAMRGVDAVVVATEWDEFRVLDLDRMKREMRGLLVMDARNLLDPEAVRRAGLRYLGVGRP